MFKHKNPFKDTQDKSTTKLSNASTDVDIEEDVEPKAQDKIVRVSPGFVTFYFIWIGGVSTCSWSSTLNSIDYYTTRVSDSVAFVLPLGIYCAAITIGFVMTFLSNKVPYHARMLFSLIALMIIDFTLPLVTYAVGDWSMGYAIIFAYVLVLGIFDTIAYASIAGLASQMSSKYTAYFLIGSAISALSVAAIKSVVIFAFGDVNDADLLPVMVYYTIIVALIGVGILLHLRFMKSDYILMNFRKRRSLWKAGKVGTGQGGDRGLLGGGSKLPEAKKRDFGTLKNCLMKCKIEYIFFFMTCIQQVLVYPGMMFKKPMPELTAEEKTVAMTITFGVFYIAAKKTAAYRQLYSLKTIITIHFLRYGLMALIIIQAVTVAIPILNQTWFGFVTLGALGFSMGFSNVGYFVLAPERVDEDTKEVAGFLIVFFVNLGNFLGGFLALTLKDVGFHSAHHIVAH